jgi:hypothetical protein
MNRVLSVSMLVFTKPASAVHNETHWESKEREESWVFNSLLGALEIGG